jgi:hypothetical protein
MTHYMISLDGAQVTGWSMWDWTTQAIRDNLCAPERVGIITPKPMSPWEASIDSLCDQMKDLLDLINCGTDGFVTDVICEYPQFMPSRIGITSATRGDLVKLAITYGRLNQVCADRQATFQGVEVNSWKGQMRKEAVIYHIKKRLGTEACRSFTSHIWDAVGIGLNAKRCWIEG